MSDLTIPIRYRAGLAKLGSLPDESFEKLRGALEKLPPMASASQISGQAGSAVSGVPAGDIEKILKSVCSLYAIRINYRVQPQRVASDVAKSLMSTTEAKDADVDPQKLELRLKTLLEVESLSYAAKATSLRGDFSCIFCDAKVITDLRPVFGKAEERPLGALITNILKLEYHEQGDHKELYFALSLDDIASLKKALERAETKNASLSEFLRSSGLPATELE